MSVLKNLPLTALAALAFLSTGCTKKESAAGGAPASTEKRNVFLFGNAAEPSSLDPQAVTGLPENRILSALFEGLVAPHPKDLTPVPGMAERWEISPDGLVYTFHLRPDLKWSNGTPITAGSIVESYKRMLTPVFAAEYSYMLWFVAGAERYNRGELADWSQVGFKAPDERTVVLTLESPTPFLLKMMANHYSWWPVPVDEIARYGPIEHKTTPWAREGRLVSNGPYRLKTWRPNQVIVAERNPHYWDAATVKIDSIEFYPTENVAAEEAMFRTDQLHKTAELPLSKIDTYRRDNPDALRIEPFLGVYFYRFNVTRPPFDDKRVRRALSLAIDRESIVRNVTRGEQIPAYAMSYPGTSGYTPKARLEGDIAEARRLLAEAGYPDGRGFPTGLELSYNTSENHRAIAEAIQHMWRQNLGIEIGLHNQEWKVYLDAQDTLSYDIQRGGWIADYVDPHAFLEIWRTGNGNNDTGWSNEEYDRHLLAALNAKSDEERFAAYQKLDAILVDECPTITIYHYTRVYALSPKVKGWHPTLLDNHPYKHLYLEE